jgi:hypothetical protein
MPSTCWTAAGRCTRRTDDVKRNILDGNLWCSCLARAGPRIVTCAPHAGSAVQHSSNSIAHRSGTPRPLSGRIEHVPIAPRVPSAVTTNTETPNVWRGCLDSPKARLLRPGGTRSLCDALAHVGRKHVRSVFALTGDEVAPASKQAISEASAQGKLPLSGSADTHELPFEKCTGGWRNEGRVRFCVPDSPQVMLKRLRFGLCLFTEQRPLS